MPSICLCSCYSLRLEHPLCHSYVADTYSSYQMQLKQQPFLYAVILEYHPTTSIKLPLFFFHLHCILQSFL